MQADQGELSLQIFLWLLVWVVQIVEQKQGPQSPLPLTPVASLDPFEETPSAGSRADSNCKNLGNSQAVLWLVPWLRFGWSLISQDLDPFQGKG